MIYTYRKIILIVIIAMLIIAGCGFGIYKYRVAHEIKPNPTQQNKPQAIIKNINTVPLSSDTKDAILRYTTGTLKAKYGDDTSSTITLREGSYKNTVAADGATTITVLIDIPDRKITYLYTQVTSGIDSMYGTSYLRCAPEDQQLVHPSLCRDVAND